MRLMKKLGSSYLFLIFFALPIVAQESRNLEGQVSSNNGDPLSGVTVSPKGFSLSVTTNMEGFYIIKSVPDSIHSLVFTHPDMETASASIGLYNTIDVRMTPLGASDQLS